MHLNRQTIISGQHGMYGFMPNLYLHEISQLGGIDEIMNYPVDTKNSNKYN